MTKYDILPFGLGFIAGVVATCATCYYFYRTKNVEEEVTEDDMESYPTEEASEEVPPRRVVHKLQKPPIKDVLQKTDVDEAEYISEERGYQFPYFIDPDCGCEIISLEQFMEDGYDKESLEYNIDTGKMLFANGDDYDTWQDDLPENLTDYFGHLSEDPNIVYVRSHPLSMDFEIFRYFVER